MTKFGGKEFKTTVSYGWLVFYTASGDANFETVDGQSHH